MGEIKFIGAILMTALFGIAIMTFAVNFAGENSASYSLDEDFNSTLENSKGIMTVYHGNISESSDAFATSELGLIDAFKTGGVFKKGGVSAIASTKNTLLTGYRKLFGAGSNFAIFLNTLFAFLTFVLIRYVYKSWVGRNPD
mgnify:CR=1 FL=1|tara:strand:- start:495 stop:920 length:426 start_codon:yes stop_codon:yes gene_type:complete